MSAGRFEWLFQRVGFARQFHDRSFQPRPAGKFGLSDRLFERASDFGRRNGQINGSGLLAGPRFGALQFLAFARLLRL
jgi:hypothetical protein